MFLFDLPWICTKRALQAPARNEGGQATVKTSRTHRRKFQGTRKFRTLNHITDDNTLTAGSHSRVAISLNSSYQLGKQNTTIYTLPQTTTLHAIHNQQRLKLSLASHSEHFVTFRYDSAASGYPTVKQQNTPVQEPTKSPTSLGMSHCWACLSKSRCMHEWWILCSGIYEKFSSHFCLGLYKFYNFRHYLAWKHEHHLWAHNKNAF
jgi:hypothetical protein